MEPKLNNRRDLMDGYILAPSGAMVAEAVCSADISIPQYRQSLEKAGCEILTQYNGNDSAGELRTEVPSKKTCQRIIDVVDSRKQDALDYLEGIKAEADMELSGDLSARERSFWRSRSRAIERKMDNIMNEDVSAEELYKAFLREDSTLRAKFVPEEMRSALEAIAREREVATILDT